VMLTSMDQIVKGPLSSTSGSSDYLLKPVVIDELLNILDATLNKTQALKKTASLRSNMLDNKSQIAKAKILLVEDNRINQQVALGILRKFDYSIDIAVNGVNAIDILEKKDPEEPYDLILMDCQMPEMDGYQATEHIRNNMNSVFFSTIPIIAMTANTMKGDKEKCFVSGMNDYISKPINPKLLEEKISYWLNKLN
jgi:CheY-like chemotaxis protein